MKKGHNITFSEFYQKASKVRAVELEIKNIKKEGLKLTEVNKEVLFFLEMLNSKEVISDDLLKKIKV